jgi:cysteine-rich repeat protein
MANVRGRVVRASGLAVLWASLVPTAQVAAAPAGCAFVGAASVRLGNGAVVDGDLGANDAGGVAHLGRHVVLADDTAVAAATVRLLNDASVFDVATNALRTSRAVAIRGTLSPVTLPLATSFCTTPGVSCGGRDVRVEKGGSGTLAPGSYGQLSIENGGTLSLAAGSYAFCGVRAARHAAIVVGGGTTIAVAGDLVLENDGTLLPAGGAPVPHVTVAGARLKIGAGARVAATFVAGGARATVGRGAVVTGALCARSLSTSRGAELRCADAAAPTTSTTTSTSTTSTSTSPTTTTVALITTTTTTTVAPTSTTSSTTSTTEPADTSTTSTSTSTSTTTITFPLNCGNGVVNTGETCDDGNNSDNDACPSDCRITACTPLTATQRFVSVRFAPPEGGLVAGITVLLDYPEGSVDLPGNGTTFPSGTISGVPTGAFVSVNDLNFDMKGHAARITVGAGSALPPGQIVRLRFQDCQGATVPPASAFPCTVLSASDPFLNPVVGATCFVVVE